MKENHAFVPEQQLINIYSQIDIPADFQEVNFYNTTRHESSVSSHHYKSSLPYSEVKDFFNASLTSKNWLYDKEEMYESISATESRRRFGYKKEGCELWVEFAGSSLKKDWNYSVGLVC